jgi:ubiquinone/menaquinone biosynthesis C-methylase UbiE
MQTSSPPESVEALPADYFDQNDSTNSCYSCENPRFQVHHQIHHYDFPFTFQKCECGLIKQTPMPNEKFFDWFFNSDVFFSAQKTNKKYIWGYYDYFKDEADRMATSRRRYRKLSHLFERKPMNIMKVGPATGTFLHVMQQNGHQVLGCDVSSEFIEHAQQTYGVQIDHGRFEKQPYQHQQFDALFLFNVIENVPNQVKFLQAVHRTLKTDGYFIFNFVDMQNNLVEKLQKSKYFIYRPPICYAYPMPTIENIMQKFGFEIIETRRDIRVMSVEKVLSLLHWEFPLKLAQMLRIHRLSFPVYAYPSWIVVARCKR